MSKASESQANKELQMRMLINLYEEKIRRVDFDNWGEDDQKDSMSRQNRYLSEISKATPIIMKVYQENLELKEHIDTANLTKPDMKELNIKLKMLKELEFKMEEAIH